MLIFTLCKVLKLVGLLENTHLFIPSDCRKHIWLTLPKRRLSILENHEAAWTTLSRPGRTKRTHCQAVCTTLNRLFAAACPVLAESPPEKRAYLFGNVTEGKAGSFQTRGSLQNSDQLHSVTNPLGNEFNFCFETDCLLWHPELYQPNKGQLHLKMYLFPNTALFNNIYCCCIWNIFKCF